MLTKRKEKSTDCKLSDLKLETPCDKVMKQRQSFYEKLKLLEDIEKEEAKI